MLERVPPEVAEYIGWRELCAPHREPIQTGATVLTGTQCAGKTTMINQLAERGFPIIPEGIRGIFEGGEGAGIPLGKLKEALPEVISTSLAMHVERVVAAANEGKPFITDRGLGDFLGGLMILRFVASTPDLFRSMVPLLCGESHYWKCLKDENLPQLRESLDRQIEYIKEWAKVIKYDKVLWLEPMPHLVEDGIRPTNFLLRMAASYFIKLAWQQLGYEPESIEPYFNRLDERVNRVLGALPLVNEAGGYPRSRDVAI